MANLFDMYGIREVANVTFYALSGNNAGKPALFLDTLKVSTIEQTGEQAEATGGWGNSPLIIWDYGREINLTIQDALYCPESLALKFGTDAASLTTGGFTLVDRQTFSAATDVAPAGTYYDLATYNPTGTTYVAVTVATSTTVGTAGLTVGHNYVREYTISASAEKPITKLTVSADGFPGTYKVVGETKARRQADGEDHKFLFVVPQAKISSETTITLEAEGDPSVFDFNLRVLRPATGNMIEFYQFEV